MTADRVLVMADDSYIMLAMGSQEACDALKAEFEVIAGSDMREVMDKTVNDSEIPEDLDLPGMGSMELPIDEDPSAAPVESEEDITVEDVAAPVESAMTPEA